MTITSGTFQSNCCAISTPDGLLAFDAQRIHGVRQIQRFVLGDFLYEAHAAIEIGVEIQHERAVGNRLDELATEILPLGNNTMEGIPAAAQ